ncbi:MAG: hypothetical protein JXB30_12075 [Anaerolineae bacterium]|nr:hypothetical protein [Anaerolineae bacterium]
MADTTEAGAQSGRFGSPAERLRRAAFPEGHPGMIYSMLWSMRCAGTSSR